jgi:ankyrin repeat protein
MTTDPRTVDALLRDIADVMFPGEDPPPPITPTTTSPEGDTPLHVYLWRNDEAAVETLLANGGDANAVGDMGETPLHVAVRQGSARIVALLLAAGADERVVSEFGQTPLALAQSLEREAIYRDAQALVAGGLTRTTRP